MNKFFVPNEVYEERMAICKSCTYYHSLLGNCKICLCFMKVKARLSYSQCAATPKKWQKTSEIETPDDLPQEIIDDIIDVWQDIKSGRAKNTEAKAKMIDIYNAIHNTSFNTHTNCGSCLQTCYDGIKKLYNKYSK